VGKLRQWLVEVLRKLRLLSRPFNPQKDLPKEVQTTQTRSLYAEIQKSALKHYGRTLSFRQVQRLTKIQKRLLIELSRTIKGKEVRLLKTKFKW